MVIFEDILNIPFLFGQQKKAAAYKKQQPFLPIFLFSSSNLQCLNPRKIAFILAQPK